MLWLADRQGRPDFSEEKAGVDCRKKGKIGRGTGKRGEGEQKQLPGLKF